MSFQDHFNFFFSISSYPLIVLLTKVYIPFCCFSIKGWWPECQILTYKVVELKYWSFPTLPSYFILRTKALFFQYLFSISNFCMFPRMTAVPCPFPQSQMGMFADFIIVGGTWLFIIIGSSYIDINPSWTLLYLPLDLSQCC